MAIITPNFNFDGQCEKAMKLYQKAFGAEVDCLLRYSDARKEDFDKELTPKQLNYIYHAEIRIGSQRIMMCDNMDIPFERSVSLSLVVTMDTREEVLQAFEVLKDNAVIIYGPRTTTYSSCEVVFIDCFGFRWGIMTEQTEK